jgi:hypothetical protein
LRVNARHDDGRHIYTDASDPEVAKLTESERGQVAPLVKRFGMQSLNYATKARAKGKERVTDEDERVGPTPPSATQSRFEMELRKAFHDDRHTDVDLISADEDRIACHQVIICSQSEVLRTMMTIGMLESQKSEIFIQNASTETLRKVRLPPPPFCATRDHQAIPKLYGGMMSFHANPDHH